MNGPCLGRCDHDECDKKRWLVEQRCRICKHKVGYQKTIYRYPKSSGEGEWFEHAVCAEEVERREQRKYERSIGL